MVGDPANPSTMTPPLGNPQGNGPSLETSQPNPESSPTSKAFPIVAIGASAGGLKAVGDLLAQIPSDTGMAFVVIQHLDPTHESQLPHLLARVSRLPIEEAVDGTRVRPDRVYVITPNTSLSIAQGTLRISQRDPGSKPHLSIDAFLRSLAVERPSRSIGVILSGTGSDGTIGLAAIKAAGGITFAQDDTAEHTGMPRSAIDRGHVDFVLRPDAIAKELTKIAHFGFPIIVPPVSPSRDETDAQTSSSPPEDPIAYARIIALLREVTGIDFTHYRSTTITRRTIRRMAMGAATTLAHYASQLEKDPEEIASLARDILINVTSFFRDRQAFAALTAKVFPELMRERAVGSPIRIWVVGCSTGQEVYSLAIELMEFLKGIVARPQVQIFATDISDWALAKARFGWYPETIADEIPSERLARYFMKEGAGFRIAKEIRDCCVFAKHDVTTDTPFSRIDLVSCRNVLIYLGPVLQKRILPLFHFALKPRSFLLLGSSESTGRSVGLYETIDDHHRIYRSLESLGRSTPSFTPSQRSGLADMPHPPQPFVPTFSEMQRVADQIVLGRFAPAGVLITESMEIIQFRGRTGPYLEPAPGEASLNLLTMVPFGMVAVLRDAVEEAKHHNISIRRERVVHRRDQTFREIAFEVMPIKLPAASSMCFLLLFEEQDSAPRQLPPGVEAPAADPRNPTDLQRELLQLRNEVTQSRNELAAATDYVHAIVQQNHALGEQLKGAQEESQSSNEEFRSTNEELQTTKEEVESANEELVTINDEMRAANADLSDALRALQASGELTSAIVDSMRYPLLVLDQDLKVVSVNQGFLDAFRVSCQESLGRLIYELGDGQWNIPDLRRLLEDILPSNSVFDDFEVTHDFRHVGTRTMLLNARRLSGQDDQSQRIVLVIADITEQTRMTKNLRDASFELLRSNDELAQFAAVVSHDLQEPLRMMSSYSALLERQYGSLFDDRAREYLGYVSEGAQRMIAMVKAILTYSHLGHESADATQIDSAIAISNAQTALRAKVEESNATIVSESLPRVVANGELLTQVFQNLLSNAIKFRSSDRIPEIRITASENDHEWTFSVADNGIGMDPAHFGKIFQLFQRLHDRTVPGSGIGLATCKKIVEHHRGRIWVESTLGFGTTFFFTLSK